MEEASTTKKNDFVELEFVARMKDSGEIFDTNIKSEVEKANLDIKNVKPFILSVGSGMIISGLDKELEGKKIGKNYISEFTPEQAFGKRDPKMVRMVPLGQFTQQKINPQRGMQFNLDGMLARVLSVSGGRVLVDFNNPLSGKTVVYDFKINKKIKEQKDKINALQDFFFRKKFDFSVSNKDNKKTINFKIPQVEKQFQQFIQAMQKPFKDILKMEVFAEVIEDSVEGSVATDAPADAGAKNQNKNQKEQKS